MIYCYYYITNLLSVQIPQSEVREAAVGISVVSGEASAERSGGARAETAGDHAYIIPANGAVYSRQLVCGKKIILPRQLAQGSLNTKDFTKKVLNLNRRNRHIYVWNFSTSIEEFRGNKIEWCMKCIYIPTHTYFFTSISFFFLV